MFRRLRTKLTVLYAGLFGVVLLLVSLAVYSAIAANAERTIRDELSAGATVYDRVWALRSKQLQDGADLTARDFGFRAAVATGDEATIRSALENLRARLDIDQAFIMGVDGKIQGADGIDLKGGEAALWRALDARDNASGVLMIGDTPYHAISAPVLSPTLSGWVVFAARLDRKELTSLERLSAIPLQADVLDRSLSRGWRSEINRSPAADQKAESRFIDKAITDPVHQGGARLLDVSDGRSIALVKPLQTLAEGAPPVVLLLRFPLAKAMAHYQPLFAALALAGLLGIVLVIGGSIALARGVTRPISALEDAARRLQRGEDAEVKISSADEIGRLAASFNGMARDIHSREAKITHLALHDGESGLPNRLSLERALATTDDPDEGLTVILTLGVDRFQFVRGAIGYELAGALVAGIGARLSQLRPHNPIARVSTDVLAVVLDVDVLEDARWLAGELISALEQPILLAGERVDVALSGGLAARGVDDGVVRSVLERASIALDQARAQRRKLAVFDEAAYGDPAGNLSLISDMLAAVAAGDMLVHHQPKQDLRTGEITAVETLVRWRHPERGVIAPDMFIPMAEETGHIRALTDHVLAQAIADQAVLRASGRDLSFAVNISGRLMSDAEFADSAIERVEAAGARLCFEITETAVIESPEAALKIIDRFAAAGIAVSIDDYGSGLSSLNYLKQIRADELKIDKAFVLSLSESGRDALLVKSTIDLAHSLGLKVTAEGVETREALALLAGMGCDHAQGYFIARPMPLEDLVRFLDAQAPGLRTAAPAATPVRARRKA